MSSIVFARNGSENHEGLMPKIEPRIRLISPDVLVEEALEHEDRDEARHRVRQEQQDSVGAFEAQARPSFNSTASSMPSEVAKSTVSAENTTVPHEDADETVRGISVQ